MLTKKINNESKNLDDTKMTQKMTVNRFLNSPAILLQWKPFNQHTKPEKATTSFSFFVFILILFKVHMEVSELYADPELLWSKWQALLRVQNKTIEEIDTEFLTRNPGYFLQPPPRKGKKSIVWDVFVHLKNDQESLYWCRCCFNKFKRGPKTSIAHFLEHARSCITNHFSMINKETLSLLYPPSALQMLMHQPESTQSTVEPVIANVEPRKRARVDTDQVLFARITKDSFVDLLADFVTAYSLSPAVFSSGIGRELFEAITLNMEPPTEQLIQERAKSRAHSITHISH